MISEKIRTGQGVHSTNTLTYLVQSKGFSPGDSKLIDSQVNVQNLSIFLNFFVNLYSI
jgi:hypothetical protein